MSIIQSKTVDLYRKLVEFEVCSSNLTYSSFFSQIMEESKKDQKRGSVVDCEKKMTWIDQSGNGLHEYIGI